MPSLDSPALTLGVLFIAGSNSDGRKFTGGETGKGLVAGGFGGASAQWAGSQIQNAVGVSTLTDELSQALAGAAISWGGRRFLSNSQQVWTNSIARGIHYNVAQQAATELGLEAGNLFGDLMGGSTTQGAPSNSGGSVSQQAVPRNRSGGAGRVY